MTDHEGALKALDAAVADPARDDDTPMAELEKPKPTYDEIEQHAILLTQRLNQLTAALIQVFGGFDIACTVARRLHDKGICTDVKVWQDAGAMLKECERVRKHYGDQFVAMGLLKKAPPPSIVTPKLVLAK